MVESLEIVGGTVRGLRTADGTVYSAKSVVITTGTFLRGVMHRGDERTAGGRLGEKPALALSDTLRDLGFPTLRLKTGTTPRIDKNSVDFTKTQAIESEPNTPPFSFLHETLGISNLLPSWLTYTNERTKAVIEANLHKSAMYGGSIEGLGPRYCPSIEDKIVRFSQRDTHQVFLEQEGWDTDSLYVQGTSTSLPADVQFRVSAHHSRLRELRHAEGRLCG